MRLPPNVLVIHLTRDPILACRSRLPQFGGDVNALVSTWIVEQLATEAMPFHYTRVRLEDCPNALLGAVGRSGVEHDPIPQSQRNEHWRHLRGVSDLTWDRVPEGAIKDRLVAVAQRYGYTPM